MARFFAPKENIRGGFIYIDGREARHILNVMRLKEKDKVIVFDGSGAEYRGFIKKTKSTSLTVEIIERRLPKKELLPKITLAQCIPKKQKMDYIVEKATELGVSEIIPIISERVIVELNEQKAQEKLNRWRKIALEASKQCGRSEIPKIAKVEKFYRSLDRVNDYDAALLACLSENTIPLEKAISRIQVGSVIVFVGPEGDFTPEEITMAKDTNCRFVYLGRRVLKSDTAPIYILSVLHYEFTKR